MSKTLISSSWRSGGPAAGPAFSFFEDSTALSAAAFPWRIHQDYTDDLPERSVSPITNRRQVPGISDDREEPAVPVTQSKKKTDSPSPADSKGASKRSEPKKKSDPQPPSNISKKPPAEKTPQKKPRDNSIKLKKNLPGENPLPVSSSTGRDTSPKNTPSSTPPGKPEVSVSRPKSDPETIDSSVAAPVSTGKTTEKILPPQVKDKTSEPETSDFGSLPPETPAVGAMALPPESDPEPVHDPEPTLEPLSAADGTSASVTSELPLIHKTESHFADNTGSPTPEAESTVFGNDFLTPRPGGDSIGDRMNTNGSHGVLSNIGEYFANMLDYSFPETAADEVETTAYVPVVLPPPRNPVAAPDPVESFRAGYISQRDLEDALGRDEWTMCCAATFVYAVQSKYPGLDREAILDAAGKAAETQLADGSGPCVAGDGYIPSIYQYSQALSENLGLKEYVDTSGQYSTVESARDAGAEMMKVELSGTIGFESKEHHILNLNGFEVDPVPGKGIEDIWDRNSSKVEKVMALEWYSLP